MHLGNRLHVSPICAFNTSWLLIVMFRCIVVGVGCGCGITLVNHVALKYIHWLFWYRLLTLANRLTGWGQGSPSAQTRQRHSFVSFPRNHPCVNSLELGVSSCPTIDLKRFYTARLWLLWEYGWVTRGIKHCSFQWLISKHFLLGQNWSHMGPMLHAGPALFVPLCYVSRFVAASTGMAKRPSLQWNNCLCT